jgi:deoxyribodipyrimidine photo-lyase
LIQQYDETYDHPGIEGTTHLGLHLRFGTVSIRELAARAKALNETFLGELIRRDFFQAMLWHFPHVAEHAFRREYDGISWRNNEEEFKRWCEGETGYPIVDAGMRELNETGFMHHRVRMITAVFLTRYLLIDWRWGAAYFAQHLLDYDLAANNGNWQLAAGCGYDTTSYAEVFNPLKAQEIDASFAYVRKWVTEFETAAYTAPIVVDEELRKQVLEVQQDALISL